VAVAYDGKQGLWRSSRQTEAMNLVLNSLMAGTNWWDQRATAGANNRVIASALGIGEGKVRSHVHPVAPSLLVTVPLHSCHHGWMDRLREES
jgi:hypothetical protein